MSNTKHLYKVLTKVPTNTLEKTFDGNQPWDQARFRSGHSTAYLIHVVNQLKEKWRDYNIPLCIAFVDYEKAFDSVQTQAVPICLISNIYKVLTKVPTKTLEKTLDGNQPWDQAGFRSGLSTAYHIHVVNQLKEKWRYYNIPLCIAFVDYEKVFDSEQTQAVLTSLQE